MKNYPAFGIILFAVLISSCTGKSSQESAVQGKSGFRKGHPACLTDFISDSSSVDMIQIFEKSGHPL
jgi:hypothetical protein